MSDDADSRSVAEAASRFLTEQENGENALKAVIDVEKRRDSWGFDEISVDSGTFGELVASGIVEKTDDEYRAVDTAAIEAVLAGDELQANESQPEESSRDWNLFNAIGGRLQPREVGALIAALTLLILSRITSYRAVFRGEHVVLPGNDPYSYRYWLEQFLAESDGITDLSMVSTVSEMSNARPFTHTANWFMAELLGGSQWAADVVAAWFPVVSSLGVGLCIYWIGKRVTGDLRVGLVGVVLLALTPIHAVYSGLGFLEHRSHQYLWLSITLVTLTWLAMDLTRRQNGHSAGETILREHLSHPWTWVAATFLGISLAFSAHAWGGSILMFGPMALYIALKVVLDLRADLSPTRANAPVLAGIGLGGVLAAGLHLGAGWHERFMAFVPLFVFAGAVGVVVIGELWRRQDRSPRSLLAVEAASGIFALLLFRTLQPSEWARLLDRADDLFFREGVTETVSLFTTEHFIIFGPVVQVGLWFFLALAALGWACSRVHRAYEPAWLLLCIYGLYWLVLATLQVRFAAQMTIAFAIFGGVGFIWLLSWIDLARPLELKRGDDSGQRRRSGEEASDEPSLGLPRSPQHGGYILAVALLVIGINFVFLPTLVDQTTHDQDQLDAALEIESHASEADRDWRDNAVFSYFGDNRMYNYFVSGNSRDYSHTMGVHRFERFIGEPDTRADELDGVFGYVIADGTYGLTPAHLGASGNRSLERYQLLYRSDDGELGAFAVVSGAVISGSGEANETVTLQTEVDVPGDSFTYERTVTADEDGYAVRVAYPGTYEIGDEQVQVSQEAVLRNETVEVGG